VEADRVGCVFDFEAGLQGAEGGFAALRGDRQRRRAAEIKVGSVPDSSVAEVPGGRRVNARKPPVSAAWTRGAAGRS
jgi:hypothetical protein